MATINKRNVSAPVTTHEGGRAANLTAEQELRRSVMACMLWEDQFYEDGHSIADRIKNLVAKVEPYTVYDMAVEARENMKLRHVPLLIVREMARLDSHKGLVAEALERVIQRADELSEFLAIYWHEKRQPLSAQVKRGLARAFHKFNAYELAKYNRDGAVKLKDVLRLVHPVPNTEAQSKMWSQLLDGTLPMPDTWETALSGGEDKLSAWTRLINENKLGALALLRNLRNMEQVGVDKRLVASAIAGMKTDRVLPFRFIAAARYAPQYEPQLEGAMMRCLSAVPRLPGTTKLLVDVSGSMNAVVGGRSEITRLDAACGLAILLRSICEDAEVYTFSNDVNTVPPRSGFALRDAICAVKQGGTELGKAVRTVDDGKCERLIVLTDEQTADAVPNPIGRGYMINVASNENGVGYGKWMHIDGWSEHVIDYIREWENWEKGQSSNKDLVTEN